MMDTSAMEAMHTYREAAQRLEELAHRAKADNKPLTARARAKNALIAMRAERAEMMDLPPNDRPNCGCGPCILYRMGVR